MSDETTLLQERTLHDIQRRTETLEEMSGVMHDQVLFSVTMDALRLAASIEDTEKVIVQ